MLDRLLCSIVSISINDVESGMYFFGIIYNRSVWTLCWQWIVAEDPWENWCLFAFPFMILSYVLCRVMWCYWERKASLWVLVELYWKTRVYVGTWPRAFASFCWNTHWYLDINWCCFIILDWGILLVSG